MTCTIPCLKAVACSYPHLKFKDGRYVANSLHGSGRFSELMHSCGQGPELQASVPQRCVSQRDMLNVLLYICWIV